MACPSVGICELVNNFQTCRSRIAGVSDPASDMIWFEYFLTAGILFLAVV